MSDTICREDAIKAIHNYWKKRLDTLPTKESEYGEVYADIQQMDKILEHNKALCNFIEAIPPADRPQEWIPCDKELPALITGVLGTDEYGYIRHVYRAIRHGKSRFETVEEGMGINILAWMPLPEPWKGADDE